MTNKKQPAGRKVLTTQEKNNDGPALPYWYRSPQEQMDFASRVWPKLSIPEPPKDFLPKTKSEVLLLHVPCSVARLWDCIFEYRHDYIAGNENVESTWGARFVPSAHANSYRILPAWVAFDPHNGVGKRAKDFYGKDDMAGTEVLSAIFQFPELPLVWDKNGFGVCAAGCKDEKTGSLLGFYLSTHAFEVHAPGGWESVYRRKLEPLYLSENSLIDQIAFPTARRV